MLLFFYSFSTVYLYLNSCRNNSLWILKTLLFLETHQVHVSCITWRIFCLNSLFIWFFKILSVGNRRLKYFGKATCHILSQEVNLWYIYICLYCDIIRLCQDQVHTVRAFIYYYSILFFILWPLQNNGITLDSLTLIELTKEYLQKLAKCQKWNQHSQFLRCSATEGGSDSHCCKKE